MAPTTDDVRYLYKLLLKRAPENDEIINRWVKIAPSTEWLVQQFLNCDEFRAKYPSVHVVIKNKTDELKQIVSRLASRHPRGELYQPIYKFGELHDGPTQRECNRRIDLICKAFDDFPVKNMSLIDVGCNMGYVTFSLAERFSHVLGVEYDRDLYDFCSKLAEITESRAKFEHADFFKNCTKYAGSYDVCLMFSVVHYLVAEIGLDLAKVELRKIARHFDFLVIELSSIRDYDYMPEDAAELLSELSDFRIIKLGESEKNDRPIFLVQNHSKLIAGKYFKFESVKYRGQDANVGSRIYGSDSAVLKVIPFLNDDYRQFYLNEADSYDRLRGSVYIPDLISKGEESGYFWLLMLRVQGSSLNKLYSYSPGKVFLTDSEKGKVVAKLITFLAELLDNGLYWNDISAHNIMITFEGDLKVLDFCDVSTSPRYDQVAMLTWILHDLELETAASYDLGVYKNIFTAGRSAPGEHSCRFAPTSDFFSPCLFEVFEFISRFDTFEEIFAFLRGAKSSDIPAFFRLANEKIRLLPSIPSRCLD